MLSRQATRGADGVEIKNDVLGYQKGSPGPLCEQDVYVELPEEAEVREDECGKLVHRLYGCRPAAQAREEHYSALLERNGFRRLKDVPVAFRHEERDMCGVVHGDDFVWEGRDEDRDWMLAVLSKEYESKNRGRVGFSPYDVKEIDMLGRSGVAWGPRHLKLLVDYFGMKNDTNTLSKNGYEEASAIEVDEGLSDSENKAYRMLAARLNYMAPDIPWLQIPANEICRDNGEPF
jgi:hypothetical protein